MIAACPLAFGEAVVKDRVKSVLNYKKPAFWIIIAAIVACVVVAVCFLTNPLNAKYKGPLSCTRYDGEKDGLETITKIDFTEDAQKNIISILNEAKWDEGDFKAEYDFEFVLKNAKIMYSSEYGVFVDKTNGLCSILDLFTAAKLSRMIGAENSKVMCIYDSPIYSFTMSTKKVPEIEIEDGVIYTVTEGVKERLGTVKKTNLNRSNFDSFIKQYEGFDHSKLGSELRKANKTTYEVTPDASVVGIEIYYIMEQKNGEMLIVYGHYDNGVKENEIRFIFSIAP
jgi:hypothetical protein